MKKNFLPTKLAIQDWLKFKPYQQPGAYDTFYLALCRKVYGLLDQYSDYLEDLDVFVEEKKRLACVLVSYYEDFISEIGIWKAFTDRNQELYGSPLPFYDLTNYEADYLNVQDFTYLIWHFLTQFNEDSTQAPDSDWMTELAEALYDLLEPEIEDSPATDVYDKLFQVSDDQNFFALKEHLHWFATRSYLIGVEFGRPMGEQAAEVLASPLFLAEHKQQILYGLAEPFVFSRHSSFSALHAPEWFARVARCSDQKRAEIKNLHYWHPGKYRLEGEYDETYLLFTHLYTNQSYLVRRDSIQHGKRPGKDGMLFQMTLIQWNREWWMTGMMYSLSDTEKDLEKYRLDVIDTPWILPEERLQTAREVTAEMHRNFLTFFGSPLALFENKTELSERSQAFMEYHTLAKGADPEKQAELQQQYREKTGEQQRMMDYSQEFKGRPDEDFAHFFAERLGMLSFQGVAEVIRLMHAPSLSPKEKVALFVSLANGFHPVFARWLLDHCPTHNVGIPVRSNVDALKNMAFLWRFHHPEEFDTVYPMVTIVPTE